MHLSSEISFVMDTYHKLATEVSLVITFLTVHFSSVQAVVENALHHNIGIMYAVIYEKYKMYVQHFSRCIYLALTDNKSFK